MTERRAWAVRRRYGRWEVRHPDGWILRTVRTHEQAMRYVSKAIRAGVGR